MDSNYYSNKISNVKLSRICVVVKMFLENYDYSIKDISDKTGISRSSVQRYLNDPIVINEFGDDVYNYIKSKLKSQRLMGNRNGGINTTINKVYVRDENGKFVKM